MRRLTGLSNLVNNSIAGDDIKLQKKERQHLFADSYGKLTVQHL